MFKALNKCIAVDRHVYSSVPVTAIVSDRLKELHEVGTACALATCAALKFILLNDRIDN